MLNRRTAARQSSDRGSALFLLPAGVLVVLVLGAITVDLTVVHLASRQAVDAATAAAADAATAGLDEAALRAGGGYRLDPDRAQQAARQAVSARRLPHQVRAVEVVTDRTTGEVTVTVVLGVEHVFAPALDGSRTTEVRGRGTAVAVQR